MSIGTLKVEDYIPVIKYNEGFYTALDFTVASGATVTLPSTTTIGGQAVVALASITSSATTGAVFSVTMSGIYTGVGAVQLVANSATSGVIQSITATGLTSGTLLKLVATEATLTSGLYINCYDGAASDFSVAKYGATVIAGTASGTAALTLTAGDILITSGVLTLTSGDITLTDGDIILTANSSLISFTGTATNGGVLKNLYNDTASALSGTQKDIKILIGATPYYFTVYPTKA